LSTETARGRVAGGGGSSSSSIGTTQLHFEARIAETSAPAPSSMNMRQTSAASGLWVVHRSTPGRRSRNSMLLQAARHQGKAQPRQHAAVDVNTGEVSELANP
jgi:hypothetical protein